MDHNRSATTTANIAKKSVPKNLALPDRGTALRVKLMTAWKTTAEKMLRSLFRQTHVMTMELITAVSIKSQKAAVPIPW
jgi:hypothetical protein